MASTLYTIPSDVLNGVGTYNITPGIESQVKAYGSGTDTQED